MKEKEKNSINRRQFLRTAGVAGLGSVFASTSGLAGQQDSPADKAKASAETEKPMSAQMPKRKLGKTGVEVPILTLGGIFNILDNQIIPQKALEWGVTYWDTADCYTGGRSESGIGKYFEKYPEKRKNIFLVSKSDSRDPAGIQKLLVRSLNRIKTDYIDLYFIHGIEEPEELTDEIKSWAQKAKKAGKIRFFGFSTHENMAECLTAAAKVGWVDALMTSYNFRVMQDPDMQAAVEACHKAGVGLVAMKTQAEGQRIRTEKDKQLVDHFLQRGFTKGQAKLKAVWNDKRFATICSQMNTVSLLGANVAAALDKTKLTKADMKFLGEYAQATCSGYCAGCSAVCNAAVPEAPYVSKVMRYLMYYNSYGDHKRARDLFAQVPADMRSRLASLDYRVAEARCPQHLPIGELMAEAMSKLA